MEKNIVLYSNTPRGAAREGRTRGANPMKWDFNGLFESLGQEEKPRNEAPKEEDPSHVDVGGDTCYYGGCFLRVERPVPRLPSSRGRIGDVWWERVGEDCRFPQTYLTCLLAKLNVRFEPDIDFETVFKSLGCVLHSRRGTRADRGPSSGPGPATSTGWTRGDPRSRWRV